MIMFIGVIIAVALGLLALVLGANDHEGLAALCLWLAAVIFSLQGIVWIVAIIKAVWFAV